MKRKNHVTEVNEGDTDEGFAGLVYQYDADYNFVRSLVLVDINCLTCAIVRDGGPIVMEKLLVSIEKHVRKHSYGK